MDTNKNTIIVFHLMGWLLFWLFPFMFLIEQSGGASIFFVFSSPWFWFCLGFYIGLFYIHTYFLLPQLFFKKDKILYFFIVLLLLLTAYLLSPYDRLITNITLKWFGELITEPIVPPISQHGVKIFNFAPPPRPNFGTFAHRPKLDVISIMIFILVIAMGFALQLAIRWRLAVQQAATAEADKANAELSFLKAQVNPHFLFNTLNNIYSLALMKDERTADSIMELSNMMRYVTDEATADFVPLQSEVNCVASYINLQRLRLGNVGLTFKVNGSLVGKRIPPMVLLVFVENVFKYGISKREPWPVAIQIDATSDAIVFYCQNRVFHTVNVEKKRAGTGISNVQKRLAYLYPDKHLLHISKESGFHTVRLTLTT